MERFVEKDRGVISGVFKGYKARKEMKKIEDKQRLSDTFKGYKIRKNIKKMKDRQDNINNIIEDNVINEINKNKMVTIELDNKINSEIITLELDEHYEKRLNDGLNSMEDGLRNNIKGCELCCCGLGNLLVVLWYKIKKCFNS